MKSNLKLQFIKTGLTLAAAFTPYKVMNYLWEKMFTIRKRALKPPHEQLLATATQSQLDVPLYDNRTAQVATYSWGEGDKTILLLHGWESKAADYYKFIPLLLAQGYKVVSLDFPAHGNSAGSKTNLIEFIAVVTQFFVAQSTSPVEAVIAHSLGGTAAFSWLSEQTQTQVKKLIMIGSPIVPKNFFESAFDFLGVRRKVRDIFYQQAATTFGKRIDDLTLKPVNPTATTQVFGLYDNTDHVVNIKEVKAYASASPALNIQYFTGTGHHQMIKNKEIMQASLDILAEK